MRLDPSSHIPIYLQIVEGIRSGIAREVYRAGEALPSIRELGLKLSVNPNTVQRAYEALERERLIESHRGKGMFVKNKGVASARTQSAAGVSASLEEAVRAAKAAGIPAERIGQLFEHALDRVFAKETVA